MAIRSAVFRRMLYGDFAEANQYLLKIGYSRDVPKAPWFGISATTAVVASRKRDSEQMIK
jgi:hypothetical protein